MFELKVFCPCVGVFHISLLLLFISVNLIALYLYHAFLPVSSLVCCVWQVELARRNEDLELFSNNTHPQYTFMKVVKANIDFHFSYDMNASFVFIDFYVLHVERSH